MVHVKHRSATWLQFMEFFTSQKAWMTAIIADFDLTMQMAHALHVIPEAGGTRMSELANELSCDASNITGVVDRLEARGYVERKPSTEDRRVKCVMLTAAGKRLRRRIDECFSVPPPAVAALPAADQRALRDILERAQEFANAQRGHGDALR